MSTDEYTPTTEAVRQHYVFSAAGSPRHVIASGAAFDRWLAARDAEVAERIAQAIEAATEAEVRYTLGGNSSPTQAQRGRADVIGWFGGKAARSAREAGRGPAQSAGPHSRPRRPMSTLDARDNLNHIAHH